MFDKRFYNTCHFIYFWPHKFEFTYSAYGNTYKQQFLVLSKNFSRLSYCSDIYCFILYYRNVGVSRKFIRN